MKRLTEHLIHETGFVVVSRKEYKRILMEEKPSLEKLYYRLKMIEDILGDDYDLDKLTKLVKADQEGQVIVIPCKPGDTVYVTCGDISEYIVDWIKYDGSTIWAELKNEEYDKEHRAETRCLSFDLGKTIFLTREAAENTLKAREQE